MGGSPRNAISAAIAIACLLALQQPSGGAHVAIPRRHLRELDTADDYTYLGCFTDTETDRVLGHVLTDDHDMTFDFCYDHCVGIGARLMATQYGIECWCATDAAADVDYDRHGEEAPCDYPCAGDTDELCGGHYAFDLYVIGPMSPPPGALTEDIVRIKDVPGDHPGGKPWADSYSVDGKCYMQTTFDHAIGDVSVHTPQGEMTIKELFDILEPGPGSEGRPLYNDIQCGNGPPNDAGDEIDCPGLVEYGPEGCGQIGPTWDLSELE